jgi:hypothetical protein
MKTIHETITIPLDYETLFEEYKLSAEELAWWDVGYDHEILVDIDVIDDEVDIVGWWLRARKPVWPYKSYRITTDGICGEVLDVLDKITDDAIGEFDPHQLRKDYEADIADHKLDEWKNEGRR